MFAFDWTLDQANEIKFVMIDANGAEVTGLGSGFTLELSKPGNTAFAASAGAKSEIGNGWYRYLATGGEADTRGCIAIKVTGAGAVQQNLVAIVGGRNLTAVEYTYTVTDSNANPIEGVQVWISTDSAGSNTIWHGETDAFGVARDDNNNLPFLDPGTYSFWSQKSGWSFTNPDTEVVS